MTASPPAASQAHPARQPHCAEETAARCATGRRRLLPCMLALVPSAADADSRPESADAQIDGRWVARPLARNGGYQAAGYARPGLISCADRDFGSHVIRNQHAQLRSSMRGLRKEGFHGVYVLNGVKEIEAAVFERERLWNGARDVHGPSATLVAAER
jgi:hypothetical protein